MAATIISQQQKIEGLTEPVIRLETALEIGLAQQRHRPAGTPQIEPRNYYPEKTPGSAGVTVAV